MILTFACKGPPGAAPLPAPEAVVRRSDEGAQLRISPTIAALIAVTMIGLAENAACAGERSNSSEMQPTILIESQSPHGNAVALLEDDGRTVFLYLNYDGDDGPVRPVWVANRVAAPAMLIPDPMRKGKPPINPTEHCAHPKGMDPFDPDRLEVVWLPEGDGVAVYESGTLLAAIPGWAGENRFFGYAREARGEGPLAWELAADNQMHGRFAAARRYWRSWDKEPDPWQRIQREQLNALEKRFGEHRQYFAIDGDKWPPKAVVRMKANDANLWVTVGMALRPMPTVERYVEDPSPFRRIELGIVLPLDAGEDLVEALADYLAWQTSLPWAQRTWLGPGHTVPCRELEAFGYPAVGLLASSASDYPIELPPFNGDPVTLLWMVPISDDEYARAKAGDTLSVLSGVRLPRPFDMDEALE